MDSPCPSILHGTFTSFPWTVYGLLIDCPGTVHALPMVCPWKFEGPWAKAVSIHRAWEPRPLTSSSGSGFVGPGFDQTRTPPPCWPSHRPSITNRVGALPKVFEFRCHHPVVRPRGLRAPAANKMKKAIRRVRMYCKSFRQPSQQNSGSRRIPTGWGRVFQRSGEQHTRTCWTNSPHSATGARLT